MHGITQLLSHHGSDNGNARSSSISSTSSEIRNENTRILQELLNQKDDGKLYLHEKHISRGSVSSAYSYGSSPSSNSSNHHSVYHTIHGNSHQIYHHHQHHQHHQQGISSSNKASPTTPSPTNENEKQHHQHHHHSIQEMIRHFGRRLGHIRRQSECQESPKKREEDFRNRSQSLDGHNTRHSVDLQDTDCETTYRIYESILKQGNKSA